MIPARKGQKFTAWFSGHAEKRIKKNFSAVRIRGLAHLQGEAPLLVVTNHTAWWDPLVALMVSNRILHADAYAMMDAKNLERLPFFGKVGAFGVNLDDARDGAHALRYAARLLSQPRRLVWLFAQGREVPITVRPLGFRGGSEAIARVSRARVVPGAIRYEMGQAEAPVLWLSFGEPVTGDHEAAVTRQLDAIDHAIVSGDDDFAVWFARQHGGSLAESMLAWLTRP